MAIGVKVRKGSAQNARARRAFRLRKKISGTPSRPRLVVSRSSRHLFVQVIDDTQSKTTVEIPAFLARSAMSAPTCFDLSVLSPDALRSSASIVDA